MNKIRSDMLFSITADVSKPLLVFTQADLLEYWEDQGTRGRVPSSIEFTLAQVPGELGRRLAVRKENLHAQTYVMSTRTQNHE